MTAFSEINVRAAAITGATAGFVFWIFSGYIGFTIGLGYGWGAGSAIILVIVWTVLAVVVASIYNWALGMK